ncbi:MAG: EamA family transporter [Clostridiales bacterium]|nr:EamA family transporter [Clostridiales bacterium]
MNSKHYIYIVIGGSLWGIISIFIKEMYAMGLTTSQIVALRSISAMVILALYTVGIDKNLMKIKIRDLHYFIGTGLISIIFFSWCYFFTIEETSVSIAVILLYTAPAIVTVISRFVFKELWTFSKIIALMLTFIGLILVTGYHHGISQNLSVIGFMTGIGSGIGYALYSIFGKLALRKYHYLTLITYTFIVASIFLMPVIFTIDPSIVLIDGHFWFQVFNLGLFPTALAYIFYTNGLVHLESSKASITATIEPIVGTLIGITVFKEILSLEQLIGIIMVISAIFVVQFEPKKESPLSEPSLN